MRSLASPEIDFNDNSWIKSAKTRRRPQDEGLFPRVLNTATVQYNMRQVPQRGMAEMLQAYRTDPWLHVCVDIIGRKFAEVPWQLFFRPDKKTGKRREGGKYKRLRGDARHKHFHKAVDTGELREIENHPLLELWEAPNPIMSGVGFRDLCAKYIKMQGESFTYKRRDDLGIVFELWPIAPTWVYRVPTEGAPYFDISVIGKTMRIPAEDMIWMKQPELLNPYTRGAGQGESLGSYIDTNHYAMEFQKAYFYNDARPNVLFHMPNADAEVVEDMKNKMDNALRGPLRSHRPIIYDAPQEMGIHEFDLSDGMTASLPLLQGVRDTFLSVFGVPPEIAGVLTSSNRATIDVAETLLARNVISPLCEFVLDEMSRQLVPEFDDRLLLGYENPVPEDKEFQLNVLKAAGWCADAGEWRELAGLPSRGDADKFYMVPALLTPTPDAGTPTVPLKPHLLTEIQAANPNNSNMVPGSYGRPAPGDASDPLSGVGNTQNDGAGDGVPSEHDAENGDQPVYSQLVNGADQSGDNRKGSKKKSKSKPVVPDYFQEISKADDKVKRVIGVVHPKMITKELDPIWQDKVAEWGDAAYEEVGAAPAFDMYNEAVKDHLEDFSGDRITKINDTTRDKIRKALGEGVDNGEDTGDLAKRIKAVFAEASTSRAKTIARTEVMRSSNFASLQGYKQSGLVEKKEWIDTPDDRTREDHVYLGEQPPIDIDDDFEVGDFKAQSPGEFGVPEMDINCRCTVAPALDTDSDATGTKALKLEVWKKFDAKAVKWEDAAKTALHKAFAEQERAALGALK